MKIGMILLAAGCSRRFGSNKLLYEIEGKPMYLRALERLLEVQRIHFSPAEKAADTQGGNPRGENLPSRKGTGGQVKKSRSASPWSHSMRKSGGLRPKWRFR